MSTFQLGSWFRYQEPVWQMYLENVDEDVIRQTGLSRDKLKQVLEILYENRIIN